MNVSPVYDVSAVLNWDISVGAVNYKVEYKLSTSSTWPGATTVTTDSFNITGLTPSTIYDWRVKSSCNGGYVYGQFTTTPPICREPGALSANPNNTSATLYWNAALYAVSYDVEYKLATDNVWTTGGNTTGTVFTLNGLAITTTYDWRIKTNCSFGGSGYGQSQFTTTTQPCDAPTGLNTTYNPGNVTTMSWRPVAGAVSYTIELKWANDPWSNIVISEVITDTSFSLTGLMSGLTLDWRVKTNCDSNYSVYAVSQLSTSCPAPLSISITNITGNGATVNWTNGPFNSPFGYTVQWKISTTTGWYSSVLAGNTKLLTGLAAGRIYDVRVRLNCYSFNSSYIQTQFTTPCSVIPSGLIHSNVTTTSATMKWTAISGVTYNLQYKTAAAANWTTVNGLTTASYNATGLVANTAYQYKVMAVCAVGSTAYSAVSTFNTYCVSSGNNSQEWIDYAKFGTLERYSGADAGGYFNSAASYSAVNFTIGTNGIPCTISSAYSGGVKSEYYAVYIDLNRNGSFADAGERVAGQSAMTNANNYNFTVNIPLTATPGVTTVRFVMLRQPTATAPCLTGNRGETEDYLITLVAPASLTEQTTPVITASPVSNETNITVSPNPSTGKYMIAVAGDFNPIQYDIMNASGIPVKNGNMRSQKQLNIDITSLPAGIYLLRLTDESGRKQVVKLVKN